MVIKLNIIGGLIECQYYWIGNKYWRWSSFSSRE